MAQLETNDPETGYSDAPGTRAAIKGWGAIATGSLLGLLALVAAAFGILPALILLLLAVPLALWGSNKLKRNAPQIRSDEPPPGKLAQ
jgi:hypothetical protein